MNWSVLIPRTPKQWATVVAAVAAVVALLYYLIPDLFHGHAVEVSVENGGPAAIFAYLDNTGRHGQNTLTVRLSLSPDRRTPPGLVVAPGATRSFGVAVGFLDQPTLHVYAIVDGGAMADSASLTDCAFDTVSLSDPKLPPWHVKVKWSPAGCSVTR